MPSLILDPAVLPLQYPRASIDKPQNVRIIAQITQHDMDQGTLILKRVPNLPQLHTHIAIDGNLSEERIVPVVVKDVDVKPGSLRKGLVVSIWGAFDGSQVNAWECVSTNGQELLDGGSSVLAEAASLANI